MDAIPLPPINYCDILKFSHSRFPLPAISVSFVLTNNKRHLVGIVSCRSCICINSCADAHRHHFLQEQLAGVRDLNLADSGGLVLAPGGAAFVSHLFQISLCCHTAVFANMNSVLIRIAKESIADEIGTTVGNQTITFHLSHTQTTITRTTF